MIPYGRQDINEEDVESVIKVLRSDYITQGTAVPEFENAISTFCGAKYAVAMNSATSALHAACLALGLGVGDSLWTSPISFVASANCGLYCGAKVDFIDIDPVTYNISKTALEDKLAIASREGRLPKILVVVHMTGHPCDMISIQSLGKKYGFKIIEDASHALGSYYESIPTGSCQYSDITIFSFHPVKIITTAEGGIATTNCEFLAERLRLLRSHGITRNPNEMTGRSDGEWYYQQIQIGYNFRMSDLQAALGLSQFQRLGHFIDIRHNIFTKYNSELINLPLSLPTEQVNVISSHHLYVIRIDSQISPISRPLLFAKLRCKNIGVNVHYIPIHLQPWYQQFGFRKGNFPEAEHYYEEAISLPIFSRLSEQKQDYIISSLQEALS